MFGKARSLLEQSWPILGSLYLLYLALQAPPVRYVGIVGLAVVTPLLVGWLVGVVVGVGPWADGPGEAVEAGGNEQGETVDATEE